MPNYVWPQPQRVQLQWSILGQCNTVKLVDIVSQPYCNAVPWLRQHHRAALSTVATSRASSDLRLPIQRHIFVKPHHSQERDQ
jgi:hypothetical protein